MKRVVLIDNEPGPMHYYFKFLRLHGYEVSSFVSADEAKEWIADESIEAPTAVILDLMMPPGDAFTMQETRNGLETGLCLQKLIRTRFPSLPVLILSEYQDRVNEMQRKPPSDPALRVVSKYEAPPSTVVKILNEMTSQSGTN